MAITMRDSWYARLLNRFFDKWIEIPMVEFHDEYPLGIIVTWDGSCIPAGTQLSDLDWISFDLKEVYQEVNEAGTPVGSIITMPQVSWKMRIEDDFTKQTEPCKGFSAGTCMIWSSYLDNPLMNWIGMEIQLSQSPSLPVVLSHCRFELNGYYGSPDNIVNRSNLVPGQIKHIRRLYVDRGTPQNPNWRAVAFPKSQYYLRYVLSESSRIY